MFNTFVNLISQTSKKDQEAEDERSTDDRYYKPLRISHRILLLQLGLLELLLVILLGHQLHTNV